MNRTKRTTWLAGVILCGGLAAVAARGDGPNSRDNALEHTEADVKHVPIVFTGGYDTDPRDHGRPVVLIAAALKVPEEVFRETFTHVTPARGRAPTGEQVRRNKEALLRGLSKYGVTNERLDAVSDYYRYNAARGETWRHAPAAAYATVMDGVVTAVTVTNPGAGYSSEPKAIVGGAEGVRLKVTLSYGTDFEKNGSVKGIAIVPAPAKPAGSTSRPGTP